MQQPETQTHFRQGGKLRLFFGTCCLELVPAQACLEAPGMSPGALPGTQGCCREAQHHPSIHRFVATCDKPVWKHCYPFETHHTKL